MVTLIRINHTTIKELWELFPIILSEHNPKWRDWANDEICYIARLLCDFNPTVTHIGSTAINDIMAKPIIDVLVLVAVNHDWRQIKNILECNGYICMSQTCRRMSFNKGYTLNGYAEKVYHIHIHLPGDDDEIKFRDYLNLHPDAAKEYERLKISLLPKYRHDRDGYTAAKTDFVKSVLAKC